MRRLGAAALGAVAVSAGCAHGAGAAVSGSWAGTFRLPAAAGGVAIAVDVHGRTATVSLGPGHASATEVAAAARGPRLRFSFPGLPANLVFSGRLRSGRLTGTVAQGRVRGTFALRRAKARAVSALGLYRSAGGAAVAVIQAPGLPTWLVELPSGTTHGLNASLTTVGTLLGDTGGDGTLAAGRTAITWTHDGASVRYERVALRQREVRVGAIAGTVTLPPGPGPFPAAVMVHGSDPAGREEFQTFSAYLESIGVAVLAADKHGVGQSGGASPGSRSDEATLGVLAADAAAQARFLASLPQVDPARVGLLGDSQAGWVIALAAAQEPAIRWAVPLVGPTTTTAETNLFTQLAGAEQSPPSGTRPELLAQVRASGPAGFDPLPSLRRLAIPVLWIFGDDDRNVPTELCVERLESIEPGHDFSWAVLHMTHALIDLPTGLYSSLARSRGFTATLFPTVGEWLRSHGLAGAA